MSVCPVFFIENGHGAAMEDGLAPSEGLPPGAAIAI